MQSAHEILNRIRWDADFGDAAFEIGYYDRVERRVLRVRAPGASSLRVTRDRVSIENPAGQIISLPLHRIRQFFREGVLIWERP